MLTLRADGLSLTAGRQAGTKAEGGSGEGGAAAHSRDGVNQVTGGIQKGSSLLARNTSCHFPNIPTTHWSPFLDVLWDR